MVRDRLPTWNHPGKITYAFVKAGLLKKIAALAQWLERWFCPSTILPNLI